MLGPFTPWLTVEKHEQNPLVLPFKGNLLGRALAQ